MAEKIYGTALLKAAKIMDFLAENPDASLQTIAKKTNITKPTTLKILDTLLFIGYVKRDENKNYRLGTKLIRYANKNIEDINLIELTLPYLEKLQQNIDETIHLGILQNDEIMYVNKLEPRNQRIRMSSKVGITRPLYSSAMGKAVLAEFSEAAYQNYLANRPLKAFTEKTITDSTVLASTLEDVRKTKIAYDNEEMEPDIFCIGTAIMQKNDIIGAFSISLPKYRLTDQLKEKMYIATLETKKQIETAIREN